MNVFDKAFQHLGFPPADFTHTDHEHLVDGQLKCTSTLVYDGIENLHPSDWENVFDQAAQMVNHELNKMINAFSMTYEKVGDSLTFIIEVLR